MLMVSSYPSFASRLTQTVIATALFSSVLWMTTADAGPLSIALPGARAFPESSPQTKLLYIPANNNICAYLPKGQVPDDDSKGFYVGYDVDSIFGSVRTGAGASDHIGELQAWDLNTGKRVWQHNFKTMLWSPLLVTGGGILFAGGTPDRMFRAFD